MSKAKPRKEKEIYQPPSPPQWRGRDSVDLAHQLNQRAFGLVREMAAAAGDWPLTGHDRTLWAALDDATIERAARFPFVILDVHFTDARWWSAESKPAALSQWPSTVSKPLMSETLVFAWHTVKWDRRVARLAFGMVPAVADAIVVLTPHELDKLSAKHGDALRLRWQDTTAFWTRLLVAARANDKGALTDIHLHAKLLLSGELMSLPLQPS